MDRISAYNDCEQSATLPSTVLGFCHYFIPDRYQAGGSDTTRDVFYPVTGRPFNENGYILSGRFPTNQCQRFFDSCFDSNGLHVLQPSLQVIHLPPTFDDDTCTPTNSFSRVSTASIREWPTPTPSLPPTIHGFDNLSIRSLTTNLARRNINDSKSACALSSAGFDNVCT